MSPRFPACSASTKNPTRVHVSVHRYVYTIGRAEQIQPDRPQPPSWSPKVALWWTVFFRLCPRAREQAKVAVVCFLPPEAQKKQLEESRELIQDECVSENADPSTDEPAEGGPDADGEMTDGIEEDFDEDGGHELVGPRHALPAPLGDRTSMSAPTPPSRKVNCRGLIASFCARRQGHVHPRLCPNKCSIRVCSPKTEGCKGRRR